MDSEAFERIIRDVEGTKIRQSVHEAECALRYGRIEEKSNEMVLGMRGLSVQLAKVHAKINAESAGWTTKQLGIAAAVIMVLLSLIAWMGGQLWALR